MPRQSTASTPKAVVASRESDRLIRFLGLRQPADRALASGRITRSKVAEAWLLHPASITVGELVEAAQNTADQLLADRLITPLSVLAGMASAAMEPSCSKAAARALLHHLVNAGHVDRLGLLTAQDEPYLALYRPADAEEIARQLRELREILHVQGSVSHDQLPEPHQPRTGRAWAGTLISHAEFAGWGRLGGATLQAWPRP